MRNLHVNVIIRASDLTQ